MLRTARPLTTERLALEPLTVDHSAEMVAVLADPALYEFTGGEPPDEAELSARYARQTTNPAWLNWIVRERENGQAVGYVQATLKDGQTAELAWVISTSFQGKGYATEAARAAVDWLTASGIDTVEAYIHRDHIASNKVAQRLGFVLTESIRDGEAGWKRERRCQN